MEVSVNYLASGRQHVYKKITGVVPATSKFPYWTLYQGEDHVHFINMYNVAKLELEGGDVDGAIRKD